MSRSDHFLTLAQVADQLGLEAEELEALWYAHALPIVRVGAEVRVPATAVEEYLTPAALPKREELVAMAEVIPSLVAKQVQAFTERVGKSPAEFYVAWAAGDLDDSVENAENGAEALALTRALERLSE